MNKLHCQGNQIYVKIHPKSTHITSVHFTYKPLRCNSLTDFKEKECLEHSSTYSPNSATRQPINYFLSSEDGGMRYLNLEVEIRNSEHAKTFLNLMRYLQQCTRGTFQPTSPPPKHNYYKKKKKHIPT